MKADEGVEKKKEIACAKDLLDNAARVQNVTEGADLAANINQRKSSNIASDVTYDELWSRAASVLRTGQCLLRVGVCLLIEWRSSQDVGSTKGSRSLRVGPAPCPPLHLWFQKWLSKDI